MNGKYEKWLIIQNSLIYLWDLILLDIPVNITFFIFLYKICNNKTNNNKDKKSQLKVFSIIIINNNNKIIKKYFQ